MSEREEFTGVIVPRFWEDLRHLPLEVRALAAHLITCRHNSGVPGCAVVSMATLADDLDVTLERLVGLWRQLPTGFAEYDQARRVLRVARVPRIGHRANHKIIRTWWRRWRALPESKLKYDHIASLAEALPHEPAEVVSQAWDETFGSVDLETVATGSPTGSGTHSPIGSPTDRGQWSVVSGQCSLLPDPESTKTVGSSTPRARAPKQPPEVTEARRQVVEHWNARFLERTGEKAFWDGKAFGLLYPLVSAKGPAEVTRRIDVLFDAPPSFLASSTPDVATLRQHFDKLAVPARAAPPRMLTTRAGQPALSPSDLAAEAALEMAEERRRGLR